MATVSNKPKRLPSQEELTALLRYDQETGKLFWKKRDLSLFSEEAKGRSWNTKNSGKEAFTASDSHGYRHGTINGRSLRAHRVVWAMHHDGEFDQIDHINGVRSDNRLSNLRAATDASNRKNQKRPKDNTSGHIGVSWHKAARKWMVEIKSEGKREYLGLFPLFEEAVVVRKNAEARLGFHQNHGRAVV